MIIGFQGDMFSNNYYAALEFASGLGENIDYYPLINSVPVLKSLIDKEIDYGIIAYENSIAGLVSESQNAIKMFEDYITEVTEIKLPIHHSLFILPTESKENIKRIYSHEQVLKQCADFLRNNFPNIELIEEKDSALAALNIVTNKYELNSAVICRKECGEHYRLELISENIEDSMNNFTRFKVFQRKY